MVCGDRLVNTAAMYAPARDESMKINLNGLYGGGRFFGYIIGYADHTCDRKGAPEQKKQ